LEFDAQFYGAIDGRSISPRESAFGEARASRNA
jgi:hypothetical protein